MNRAPLGALVRPTPLIQFEKNLFLKAENLQTGRSYKIRGVVRALEGLPDDLLARGVATVSAGNLGQALARAASLLQVPCRIFVPDSAPEIKKQKILQFGAELIPLPFPQIWDIVRGKIPETGMHFLHPSFCQDLQHGYGEISREILAARPDTEILVIPYGLGSLFLGMATAMKSARPGVEIYACEIECAAPLAAAMKGRPDTEPFRRSPLVDAIGTPELIPDVFRRICPLVKESLVVSEEEAALALKDLYDFGLVVEGAAAVAFAAARELASRYPNKQVSCVLSGGNLDREQARSFS